jgi:hypothetical protein
MILELSMNRISVREFQMDCVKEAKLIAFSPYYGKIVEYTQAQEGFV